MMEAAHERLKRGRTLALLLALLYGVLSGGAFAPLPVQAQPLSAHIGRDGQTAIAIPGKSGAATIKAHRPTVGPALLPSTPRPISQSRLHPAGEASLALAGLPTELRATPYQARAPPAL